MKIVLWIISFLIFVSCTTKHDQIKHSNQEFSFRFDKIYDRLTGTDINPVFTEEFILADIKLDTSNTRSFTNYSGDLSGRYIQAMSHSVIPGGEQFLKKLVHQAIKLQKKDGRFGNTDLDFNGELTADHMALLWGNGRLLSGFTEYCKRFNDPEVLEASRKLGHFYLSTVENCSKPANVKRLTPFGASGIIGFTGGIESLVTLSQLTGDPVYAQTALKVYPILPPRGNQHSHGYLTTLRGVMKLYGYFNDEKLLKYVLCNYDSLINSPDYTIMGGVTEYFGGRDKEPRDEGCSQTDFIRLSFDLFRATGELKYLDNAEYAIYNALYANQYCKGDFGHHILLKDSLLYHSKGHEEKTLVYLEAIKPGFNMAAWWCCDMSGMLTMDIIKKDFILTKSKTGIDLNLFLESKIQNEDFTVDIVNEGFSVNKHWYKLDILDLKQNQTLRIRLPGWADKIAVKHNGKEVSYTNENSYLKMESLVSAGDNIEIGLEYKIVIKDIYGNTVPIDKSSGEISGYLIYGPYLMAADDNIDPDFMAEPNNNVVQLKYIQPIDASYDTFAFQNIFSHQYILKAKYKHGGYQGIQSTFFRPVNSGSMEKLPYSRFLNVFVN